MNIRWISLLSLFAFVLAGCGSYQAGGQIQDSAPSIPQEHPSKKPSVATPNNKDSSLPQLPAPTIGSVVITNTTATPMSSAASASALTPDPAFAGLIEQAKEDLAKRLSIDVSKIDLLKVVPATWPYDSLGCPPANTENANTPGYQILLIANNEVFAYHIDGKDLIGLCSVKPPNEIRTLP